MKTSPIPTFLAFAILLTWFVFNTSAYCQNDTTQTKSSNEDLSNNNFRKGYMRLGFIAIPKSEMDYTLSPFDNLQAGRTGAGLGYTLEFGRNYYFNHSGHSLIKYGLDWTVISINYSELDWRDYSEARLNSETDQAKFHYLSLASKLGPVLSINPIEKLVLDFRVQVGISFHSMLVDYYEDNNGDSFSLTGGEGSPLESISELSIFPNLGITIRRKWIGFAMDYFKQTPRLNYSSELEGEGTVDVPISTKQIKMIFSFNSK
ncbi:hypothetical protein QWY93_17105 [Echinicola jeungdonensis]|uniref:Outer membrane protein beta-barrel domain-containing protein n=1 Tax=Echinicola jeungdonensis TaxID=709343 RepID=A0ABV5J5L2_9BACT|nr:hypothetical protein [Echinicola jeungdonensis]MDN3671035.1 hypothetical protein [Echinicola jeungdonensis]